MMPSLFTQPKLIDEIEADDEVVWIYNFCFKRKDSLKLAEQVQIKYLLIQTRPDAHSSNTESLYSLPPHLISFVLHSESFMPSDQLPNLFWVFRYCKYLECLILPNVNLGLDTRSLLSLAGALEDLKRTLKMLEIKNNHLAYCPDQLAFAIENLSSLESLNLANNGISGHTIQLLAPAFAKLSRLRCLDLNSNGIDYESMVNVFKALGKLELLEELHVSGNPILHHAPPDETGKLGLALGKLLPLRILDLSSTCRLSEHVREFASAISKLESLETLDLRENNLGEEGIFEFSTNVSLPRLKTLHLTKTCFKTEQSARNLARFLEKLPTLERLELGDNKFLENEQSVEILAKSLERMKKLVALNLMNTGIGLNLHSVLTAIKPSSTFKQLVLQNCPLVAEIAIDNVGLPDSLEELDLTNTGLENEKLTLISPAIAYLHNLKSLKLGENNLDSDCVVALVKILNELKDLQVLDLSENKFGVNGMQSLAKKLESLTELVTLNFRSNNLSKQAIRTLAFHLVDFLSSDERRKGRNVNFECAQAWFKVASLLCALHLNPFSRMRILPLDIIQIIVSKLNFYEQRTRTRLRSKKLLLL